MKAFASKERHNPARPPALIVSYDGRIDPGAYGYITDHELARRPLRQKLQRFTDSAKGIIPDWETKVSPVRRKLEEADVVQKAVADAIEIEIDQLRRNLMASRWGDEPVVVWPCGPWQPLSPDALPTPTPVSLSARLLQDEYQELSVAVTNTTSQPRTIEATLTAADGSPAFPAEKLTLRGSYWIATRGQGFDRGEGLPTLVDDALPRLADGKHLALAPGQTRQRTNDSPTGRAAAGSPRRQAAAERLVTPVERTGAKERSTDALDDTHDGTA